MTVAYSIDLREKAVLAGDRGEKKIHLPNIEHMQKYISSTVETD